MKVAIVGSRALEVDGNVAIHVVTLLAELPPDTEVLVRRPLTRPLRPFEALVSALASSLGHEVTEYQPEPGGRSQVFLRDVELVRDADEVIALFPDGDEMSGGTGHVVDKAIDQQRPVRAYAVEADKLRLIAAEDWSAEGQA